MADAENQDQYAVVLDLAHEAVITHSVFPELPEEFAVQRFADTARVFKWSNSVAEKFKNAPCDLRVELAYVPIGAGG